MYYIYVQHISVDICGYLWLATAGRVWSVEIIYQIKGQDNAALTPHCLSDGWETLLSPVLSPGNLGGRSAFNSQRFSAFVIHLKSYGAVETTPSSRDSVCLISNTGPPIFMPKSSKNCRKIVLALKGTVPSDIGPFKVSNIKSVLAVGQLVVKKSIAQVLIYVFKNECYNWLCENIFKLWTLYGKPLASSQKAFWKRPVPYTRVIESCSWWQIGVIQLSAFWRTQSYGN